MTLEESFRQLEVAADASFDEVRTAYKRLVLVWHPDRFPHNPDLAKFAESKLKQLNEAFATVEEVLKARRNGSREPHARKSADSTNNPYVDGQCWYCGEDPRLVSQESLQRFLHSITATPASVQVAEHGVVLAVANRMRNPQQVLLYPPHTIRELRDSRGRWGRVGTTYQDYPYQVDAVLQSNSVTLVMNDPEGLTDSFNVKLRFRNEYLANLFVKNIRQRFLPFDVTRAFYDAVEKNREAERTRAERRRQAERAHAEELWEAERARAERARQAKQTRTEKRQAELARTAQKRQESYDRLSTRIVTVVVGVVVAGMTAIVFPTAIFSNKQSAHDSTRVDPVPRPVAQPGTSKLLRTDSSQALESQPTPAISSAQDQRNAQPSLVGAGLRNPYPAGSSAAQAFQARQDYAKDRAVDPGQPAAFAPLTSMSPSTSSIQPSDASEQTEKGTSEFSDGLEALRSGENTGRPEDYQKAVRSFKQASDARPSSAIFKYYLAASLFRAGSQQEADTTLKSAIQMELQYPIDRTIYGRKMEQLQGPARQWLDGHRETAGIR